MSKRLAFWIFFIIFVASCESDKSRSGMDETHGVEELKPFEKLNFPTSIYDEVLFSINWMMHSEAVEVGDVLERRFAMESIGASDLLIAWYHQRSILGQGINPGLEAYGLPLPATDNTVLFVPSSDCSLSQSLLEMFVESLEVVDSQDRNHRLFGFYQIWGFSSTNGPGIVEHLRRLIEDRQCLFQGDKLPDFIPHGVQIYPSLDIKSSTEQLIMQRELHTAHGIVVLDQVFGSEPTSGKNRCKSVFEGFRACEALVSPGGTFFWRVPLVGEMGNG